MSQRFGYGAAILLLKYVETTLTKRIKHIIKDPLKVKKANPLRATNIFKTTEITRKEHRMPYPVTIWTVCHYIYIRSEGAPLQLI